MSKTSFVLFFLLCSFSSLFAEVTPMSQYKIRRVSPIGGLCMNGQRDVRQDKWGFIWVITVTDLYRFDGYTFKRYTERLSAINPSSTWRFNRIEIDKEGNIFVATDFGLLKYNILSDNFDCILNQSSSLVRRGTNGRLWVNTHTIGIFDDNTKLFMPILSEEGIISNVSAICIDSEDVYIGTETGNVYFLDQGQMRFRRIFSKSGYNTVDISRLRDKLYVLTENSGLSALDIRDFSEIKRYTFFYPGNDTRVSARSLFIDNFGNVWITGQRGIYMLDPSTDNYIRYSYEKTNPYGMPSSSVWRVSEDNQGNLWFGTYSGGLCYINLNERNGFRTFNALTDELSFPVVSSFAEQDACIWIGTEGGGLNRYDKETGAFTHYTYHNDRNSLSYDNIQSLLFVHDKLWIGMPRGGLDCLDPQTGQFTHYTAGDSDKPLVNNHIARLVSEGDSGIWIIYLQKGNITYRSLKDNTSEHFYLDQPVIQGEIVDIAKGNNDTLWLATSKRLAIMNTSTRKLSYAISDSVFMSRLANVSFQSIYADNEKGIIWMGSSNGHGLIKYSVENQQLSICTGLTKYGVYTVASINADDKGCLWLGTDNGLFRYDTSTEQFQQFTKADGAQGRNYYNYSTFKSKAGELYFGGNEGFTIINPQLITANEYKPYVIISEFLLDVNPVTPSIKRSPLKTSIFQTKELILDYNQNNFTFEFSSSNYLNPDKNRFKYRLIGYNDYWIETDAIHRVASYVKVPTGKYTFEVMTANNDGEWGDETTLQITVRPAPWFSWWAIVFYAMLSILILYIIIRYYIHQKNLEMQVYLEEHELKQKEEYHQAQLRFFTDVSHDFRAPIFLIIASLEEAKAENVPSKYMKVFENNTRRLDHLVNELMDFRSLQDKKVKIKINKGDWSTFVNDNCSDFFEYAHHKNIHFVTNCEQTLDAEYYFDSKIMEKILLNLLNNAFKYTADGGQISVSTLADVSKYQSSFSNKFVVRSHENEMEMFGFVISDNGVGISQSSIVNIFDRYFRVNDPESRQQHLGSGIGLALVKALIQVHHGDIYVFSERDKGTDIVVGFPVNSAVYQEDGFNPDEINFIPFDKNYSFEESIEEFEKQLVAEDNILYGGRKTILLVEDDDELRELVTDILSPYFDVKVAENGIVAMQILEDEDIDMLVADIMMSAMNGIELCKRVKGNLETAHIPVVILTGNAEIEIQIESLHSGADVYLRKPVSKKILLCNIVNLFNQQVRLKEYHAKYFFADSNDASGNKQDAEFMKQFIDIIDANIMNTELDVFQIASDLAMSRRKLYGKVKALTDQSVVEFIRNYRLQRAARIIIEEDVPINIVMEKVGIDNASYFSRIFKKKFGESPSDFYAKWHNQG